MKSGSVTQDGLEQERKMTYEPRVARRERSVRRRQTVMADLESKRVRRVSNGQKKKDSH